MQYLDFTEPKWSLVLPLGDIYGNFNKLLLWGSRKVLESRSSVLNSRSATNCVNGVSSCPTKPCFLDCEMGPLYQSHGLLYRWDEVLGIGHVEGPMNFFWIWVPRTSLLYIQQIFCILPMNITCVMTSKFYPQNGKWWMTCSQLLPSLYGRMWTGKCGEVPWKSRPGAVPIAPEWPWNDIDSLSLLPDL